MQLTDLGWDGYFEKHFEAYRSQGFSPVRIVRENRELYTAYSESGELSCELSGKFRFNIQYKSDFPSVGDWVVASVLPNENKAVIHSVLPRKSVFSRKIAGEVTDEQVVASNIDTVFIVTGLDLNYNLRRIERYLTMAWNSGATPVVLLNKADLCVDEIEARIVEVESVAFGVEVFALSAAADAGLEIFDRYIASGKTVAFLGSSGAGKSTIINRLLGEERLKVGEVSKLGSRGHHTTTSRELILIPSGGIVIDTPGMRELQVWGDDEGLKQVFDEIEEMAKDCRYKDCTHQTEPGCAVLEALQQGRIDPKRLESYFKLRKEFEYIEQRQTMKASEIEKAKKKKISKLIKAYFKDQQ